MPEAVIHYENPKVLKVLQSISELFGFTVTQRKTRDKTVKAKEDGLLQKDTIEVDGLTVIPAEGEASDEGMAAIFKGVDARKLRKESWQRGNG